MCRNEKLHTIVILEVPVSVGGLATLSLYVSTLVYSMINFIFLGFYH
jgi:hypothetical protein